MLTLTCKINEVVEIGEVAAVRVLAKPGNQVRLAIAAPRHIDIRLNPKGIIEEKYLGLGTVDRNREKAIREIKSSGPLAAAAY